MRGVHVFLGMDYRTILLDSASTFENSCGCSAGLRGNDRADRLAGKATLSSGLVLGRSEVLRNLKHYLRAQSQGHRTIDLLEERGVQRGSATRSSVLEKTCEGYTFSGTVLKAKLGKLMTDGVERMWGFPSP